MNAWTIGLIGFGVVMVSIGAILGWRTTEYSAADTDVDVVDVVLLVGLGVIACVGALVQLTV